MTRLNAAFRWQHTAVAFAAGLAGCQSPESTPAPLEAQQAPIVHGRQESGYPGVGALTLEIPGFGYMGAFCSGTLIDPQWVLTAAHCIIGIEEQGLGRNPEYIKFFTGSNADNGDGDFHDVDELYVHPGFRMSSYLGLYDIALMHLSRPASGIEVYPFNEDAIEPLENQDVLAVGFGASNGFQQSGGGLKRSTTLSIVEVRPTFYVSQGNDTGVCFGDSGGPGLKQFGDQLRVIGVNSNGGTGQNGLDPCLGASTQTRTDAYKTWINQTMGEDVDCGQDASLCACAASCQADGLCDDVACNNQTGCEEILNCLNSCGDDLSCSAVCYDQGSAVARENFDNFVACLSENCSSATNQEQCANSRCASETEACLNDIPGQGACGVLFECVSACSNSACATRCTADASPTATAQLEAVLQCAETNCAAFANDEARYNACTYESCVTQLDTCMPPAGCEVTGGSCGTQAACLPAAWGSTYCEPSAGGRFGDACDANALPVACSDGFVCAAGKCQEACLTDQDCPIGTCNLHAGTGHNVGVCEVTCTDADGDGTCASRDCDDSDAAIHPGVEERCDNAKDDNCDGQVDEGCGACTDADGDGTCAQEDCDDQDSAHQTDCQSPDGGAGGAGGSGAGGTGGSGGDEPTADAGQPEATSDDASSGCQTAVGAGAGSPALFLLGLLALLRRRR